MHHSLCKFRQNSFCLSSIYVRFYERTVPISFEPLFQRFKKRRRVFCRIEVVYVECLYYSSYERSYMESVIKNLAAYKCFRRTEYVVRLYYIITTKVFLCIYYVSTIKGHFCKSFAIFTESILASIKTKLTGSHSIRHKLDQYLL